MTSRRDLHSCARPEDVRVTHCSLSLDADFDSQVLNGIAELKLRRSDPKGPLRLDTRDLDIKQVVSQGVAVPFRLGSLDPVLGRSLEVDLPAGADSVTVHYASSPSASGLQWLAPEQTAGHRHPFLFSQNQSIHARSWIPIQDSPGVRITFDARITTDPKLRVVMAAEASGIQDGSYLFRMTLPVPPYLIAMAIGDIGFASVGSRTGIYAEPCMLPAAKREFDDLEELVSTVESLYGRYRWGAMNF